MNNRLFRVWSVGTLLVLGIMTAAQAAEEDDKALLEGAKMCTQYLPRHEREFGIPVHLLAAIASTESGRFHRAFGLNLPWPWTINVEGKGYYFDNKQEAIAAVQKLQARGFESIDVGCMQVNLHHHPKAFANLDQAFEPANNVAYAAFFLKQNFLDEKSWRKAIADYHSHTPAYGEQYAKQVVDAWSRIIAKVEDAHAGRPLTHAYARQFAAVKNTNKLPSYHAPHLHSMSVSSAERDGSDVQVVHTDVQIRPSEEKVAATDDFITRHTKTDTATNAPVQPVTVADASEAKSAQIVSIDNGQVVKAKGQFQPSSHVVTISSPAPTSKPVGSMFVFDN